MKKWMVLVALAFILNLTASPEVLASGQESVSPTPRVLTAIQHSGFTPAADAFENYCEVTETGDVNGYFHSGWTGNGWVSETPYTAKVAGRTLAKLKKKIKAAKTGVISAGDTVCDAGTTNIAARGDNDTDSFIVVQAYDCEQIHINQDRAAQKLRDWVASQCKIKY